MTDLGFHIRLQICLDRQNHLWHKQRIDDILHSYYARVGNAERQFVGVRQLFVRMCKNFIHKCKTLYKETKQGSS